MRGAPFDISDLSGGLNVSIEPELLPTSQAQDLYDVIPVRGRRGAIRRRDGSTLYGPIAGPMASIFNNGAVDANNLNIITYSTGSGITLPYLATLAPGSSVPNVLTNSISSTLFNWVRAVAIDSTGPFYGMDVSGTTSPSLYWWNGASGFGVWSARSGTGFQGGNCLAYFQNRMFIGGGFATAQAPAELRSSDIGDVRSWPGNSVLLAPGEDTAGIRALGVVGPYLIAFKQHGTWAIYDSDTGANRRLSATVGCGGAKAVCSTPAGLVWVALDGNVYITDGSKISALSDPIFPLLRQHPAPALARAAVTLFDGRVIITVPPAFSVTTGTTPGAVYDYDFKTQTWWRHSQPVVDFTTRVTDSGTEELWGAWSDATNTVYRVAKLFDPATPTDGGTAFTGYWQSGQHTHRLWRQVQVPAVRKHLRAVHVRGSGTVDVSILKNGSTDTNAFKRTLALSGSGEGKVLTPGRARTHAVRFASASAFEVDGYTMFADLKPN